ncbi:hypothetical protein CRENBAI_007447 [Crenichthys baileyi]|uniref:Uncharacterized protein n=1 Tax=Crenichthys baileyi TaxID=28760 RepID=A0AAV9SL37_9TELE
MQPCPTTSRVNLEEREILLKQASGRMNIRKIPCPVYGCHYNKGRCDKHLSSGHPELTDTLRSTYISVPKENKTKQLFMELRATNPVPPMASARNGSVDEEGADVGSPLAAPSFDSGDCRSLALENDILKHDLAKLCSSYEALHKRLRRSASDVAGVSEEQEEEAGLSSSTSKFISQAVSPATSKAAVAQSSSQAETMVEGELFAQHEDMPSRYLSFPKSIDK